ncbi:hypothetical protein [Nostoc sp.]|uniref:hypothetical protein n=1 Tax=Nostoc sp. TaxID=1180 RepID=UPI002FF659E7
MTRGVGVLSKIAMPPAGYAYAPMALLQSCRAIALNSKSLFKRSDISKSIVTNSTLQVNEVHPSST